MSSSNTEVAFTAEDYLAIENAVHQTERGRWFLEEHAKRHRTVETDKLLEAIGKLETNVAVQTSTAPQTIDTAEDLTNLKVDFEAVCQSMAAIHNDMLDDNGAVPTNDHVFDHTAKTARHAANNLSACAQKLQAAAMSLSEEHDADIVTEIRNYSEELFKICWLQDVVAQRVAQLTGFARQAHERLGCNEASIKIPTSDYTTSPESIAANPLTSENLKFFQEDDELFEDPPQVSAEADSDAKPTMNLVSDTGSEIEPPASDEAAEDLPQKEIAEQPANPRIVVIRSGADTSAEKDSDNTDSETSVELKAGEEPVIGEDIKIDDASTADTAADPAPMEPVPAEPMSMETMPAERPGEALEQLSADNAGQADASPAQDAQPANPNKQRITIIRRKSNDESAIPFGTEPAMHETAASQDQPAS